MLRVFLFLPLQLLLISACKAEVYQCDDGKSITFTSIPCDNIAIQNTIKSDEFLNDNAKEEFLLPVYPQWKGKWQQIINFRLEYFTENEYSSTFLARNTSKPQPYINLQTKSNVPTSLSVNDITTSYQDTIDSICETVLFDSPRVANKDPSSVFYGRYFCSKKRVSEKGELGIYKIIRGEQGVNIVTVKWLVAPFIINHDSKLMFLNNNFFKQQFNYAKSYLQHDTKLCKGEICY